MEKVIFYEKHGCTNNTRQKGMLSSAGYAVEARNLLEHPWSAESLRPFFGSRPVAEWFNRAAPRVKNGLVSPESMDETTALQAMLADPLLIRRPLIQLAEQQMAGFDAAVEQRLGLARHIDDVETCTSDVPCREIRIAP